MEFDFLKLVKLSACLPLFSFVICVLLSIYKDFDQANTTHCGVYNIFPSISASIGGHLQPQNAIWRMSIGLDSFIRYFISYIHYQKYYKIKQSHFKYTRIYFIFVKSMFGFNAIELASLMLLSYVSSVEDFYLHQTGFILFISASYIYMVMSLLTFYWPKKHIKLSFPFNVDEDDLRKQELNAKKLKKNIFLIYNVALSLSFYFYVRHNTKCEPFVYSLFSLCEYVVVLTNIAFHMTIISDMSLLDTSYSITIAELKKK